MSWIHSRLACICLCHHSWAFGIGNGKTAYIIFALGEVTSSNGWATRVYTGNVFLCNATSKIQRKLLAAAFLCNSPEHFDLWCPITRHTDP